MSTPAGPNVKLRRVRPRTERRSLRRLRFEANLPRYAVYAVAAAAVLHYALGALGAAAQLTEPASVDLPAEAFALGSPTPLRSEGGL